jgi:hypothetical protein
MIVARLSHLMFTQLKSKRRLLAALRGLLLAALMLLVIPSRSASAKPAQSVVLTVAPSQPGTRFALGAVGLSAEADELSTGDLGANRTSLVALMRRLGPGVLRIGGNSVDYSWWTANNERPPTWATSVVTPSDLVNLRGLLEATGWRAILGVDLGHLDPARAGDEARVAGSVLGSRLLAFEIGNEPNNYGDPLVKLRPNTYGPRNYLEELATYVTAMRTDTPSMRVYGPDLGARSLQAWLPFIASDKATPFATITQHYYPTAYNVLKGFCKGTTLPTAVELLSTQVRERENLLLQTLAGAGDLAQREIGITETNTTASCDTAGGPATSPVFASALWAFDWILRSASAGVTAIDFHGYLGRCAPDTFSPICAPSATAEAHGQLIARPEYYGLVAARELEGGRFVPVDTRGQGTSENFSAYATVHARGVLTLGIDNFASRQASFLLSVPGYTRATAEFLAAPSLGATNRVTFGHASAGDDGALLPSATIVTKANGAFRLTLPHTSAIVVTLHR